MFIPKIVTRAAAPAWRSRHLPSAEVMERRALLAAAPIGGEFQVSPPAEYHQVAPAVAADADGDFVVAWKSYDSDVGGVASVHARRYGADGAPRGPAFRVSQADVASAPAVAMDDDGDFVVVWNGRDLNGVLTTINARRYSAAGAARGNQFAVHSDNRAGETAVAMDADGDFVVAFEGYSVEGGRLFARRFNAAGTPQGDRFGVTPGAPNVSARYPSVAMDRDGDFAVAWESTTGRPEEAAVRVQRFNRLGVPQGAAAVANPDFASTQSPVQAPKVAMDADGELAVTWFNHGRDRVTTYARLYTPSGEPKGPAFPAFDFSTSPDGIAMDADGGFVIVARCRDGNAYPFRDELEVCARRFDRNGVPREAPFRVNAFTEHDQRAASVAMDDEGDFVVAWEGQSPGVGAWTGVAGQAFDGDAPVPAAEVVGHHVFYLPSRFDLFGNPSYQSVDNVLDPTKTALLPGQAPSSANLTSYDRGLNGLVVDVAGLPREVGATLGLDDFDFGAAPPPAGMLRRRGAGAGGSDRVHFFWRDGPPYDTGPVAAVVNDWLTVTVKANERTALAAPHVFAFGNLIGDTGGGGGMLGFRVNALDLAAVKRDLNSDAPLASTTDFNRDGRTNALDLAIVRRQLGVTLGPPSAAAVSGAAREDLRRAATTWVRGLLV